LYIFNQYVAIFFLKCAVSTLLLLRSVPRKYLHLAAVEVLSRRGDNISFKLKLAVNPKIERVVISLLALSAAF